MSASALAPRRALAGPVLLAVPCILLVGATLGCSALGSASLRNGRSVYNDAIVATNNEQLLAMIVRMRYLEPAGLLNVSSVTANVRFQGSVNAQFGVGPESTYAGNLVPLAAGALYEENPTISYTPVQGSEYLRQMLSPLPLDLVVLLLRASGDSPQTIEFLVQTIGPLRSGAEAAVGGPDEGQFRRLTAALATLASRGWLEWGRAAPAGPAAATAPVVPAEPAVAAVHGADEAPAFALVLQGSGEEYRRLADEVCSLLGVAESPSTDGRVVLRVESGVGHPRAGTVDLHARSVYDLFAIAAASVDVPPEHLASGLAPPVEASLAERELLRIGRSASRPAEALVAVQHHGVWYSISGTDSQSKAMFRILAAIVTARIADSVDPRVGQPVLTVPVAR